MKTLFPVLSPKSKSWQSDYRSHRVGTLLALLVVLAVGGIAWFEKNETIHNDWQRGELFARTLEDHADRTFEITSLAMTAVSETVQRLDTREPTRLPENMSQTLATLSFIRSMAVVDMDGRIVMSTYEPEQGLTIDLRRLGALPSGIRTSIAPVISGRYLGDLDTTRVVQQPPDRGVQAYSLPIVRVLSGKGPQTLYLVAIINPDFLANFQGLVIDTAGYASMLVSYNGQVLASHGLEVRPGDQVDVPALEELVRVQAHDTYVGPGVGAGEQLVIYRASRVWPTIIIVERPMAALTESWLKLLTWFVGVGGMAILVIAVMSRRAGRSAHAREEAQRQLFVQLSFIERLIDICPLPVYMVDHQGHVLIMNRACEEFTGLLRASVIGHQTVDFLQDSVEGTQGEPDKFLATGGGEVRYERTFFRSDGVRRNILVSRVLVAKEDGQAGGVLSVIMDVTEFREAERAISVARDAAQVASRTKSEFIANISHELRTPLQSILGFSELGQMRELPGGKTNLMFQDIHASGQRMLALVNNLLDISKIENANSPLVLSVLDLRLLLDGVVVELAALLQARKLTIARDVPDGAYMVCVDALRIQQVLRNVLANAIKFSPTGGSISVALRRTRDASVHLCIRDQGCGVPDNEAEHIFEPFVQSSRTKDGSGGTGLGLAISRRILIDHGGTIHAENVSGSGAAFHLYLPLAVQV